MSSTTFWSSFHSRVSKMAGELYKILVNIILVMCSPDMSLNIGKIKAFECYSLLLILCFYSSACY
jgi:hypothetical protein